MDASKVASTGTGLGRQSQGNHGAPAPYAAQMSLPPGSSGISAEASAAGRNKRQSKKKSIGSALVTSSALATARAAASQIKYPQRRKRLIASCMSCRTRKLRCSHGNPCDKCRDHGRQCVYVNNDMDERGEMGLIAYKDKMTDVDMTLPRMVANGVSDDSDGDGDSPGDDDGEDEEGELQITPMVALDLTYDDYSDGNDLIDLGIRVGRMRITERIGGLNRPRISEEIRTGIADAQRALGIDDELPDAPGSELVEFLKPGESYLAPTSGFFFGLTGEAPHFIELLLSENLGNNLVQRYFDAVHPIARCVHRPSFDMLYRSFWDDVRQNIEPRPSTQAVVFAAWFSAAVTVDEIFARRHGCTKAELVSSTKIGAETALSKARFLSTTRFETLQGFVMYLLPLCRDEVSRGHSVLVGAAVRMAECMGLHRDGLAYGLSPLETEVRRLIWHQLCFLDIRTCEAQGPKPTIRREDYDTKLPTNCEEEELTADPVVAPAPAEKWTPMLFSIMRFEINEMMRTIWTDRRKLEMHKTTLTAMLAKIEHFRKGMHEKYNRFFDDSVPIQKYAKLVMQLLVYRLHAMVLHPFHSNTVNPLPDKLNGLLVSSGILIIDTAIKLESGAMFRDWSWYLGAYQQYHIALLLATEVHYRPNTPSARRIWPCLDWVFNLDPNQSRGQKSVKVLAEIMAKTDFYMSLRKVRAPMTMSQAVPGKQAVKEASPPPPPQSSASMDAPLVSAAEVPRLQPATVMPPPMRSMPPQQMQPIPPPRQPLPQQQRHPLPQQQRQPAQQHQQQQHQHMPPLPQHQPMPPPTPQQQQRQTMPPQQVPPQMPLMMPPPHQQQQHQQQHQQQQQQHQLPLPHEFDPSRIATMPPPMHSMQLAFSGVMAGEPAWNMPPLNTINSPGTSSDGGSVVGGHQPPPPPPPPPHSLGGLAGPGGGGGPDGGHQHQYDWEMLNTLFPTDPDTGQFGFTMYPDSTMPPTSGMAPPGMLPPPGMGSGMGPPPVMPPTLGIPMGSGMGGPTGMAPHPGQWQQN